MQTFDLLQAQHFPVTFAWDLAQISEPQHQPLLFALWTLAPVPRMQKSWHQCQETTWKGETSSDPSKRNHCRCLSFTFSFLNLEGTLCFMLLSFPSWLQKLVPFEMRAASLVPSLPASSYSSQSQTKYCSEVSKAGRGLSLAVWASSDLEAVSWSQLWTAAHRSHTCRLSSSGAALP